MSEFLVQHTWKPEQSEIVVRTVNGIVEMAKASKLPDGFRLKSISVAAGEPKAFCTWDAPNKSAISELLQKVNPPTQWSVSELSRLY